MNNDINLLVTLTDKTQLLQVALKLNTNMLTPDQVQYWAEPENLSKIGSLLPYHCQSFGAIVKVEEIFEIKDWTEHTR